MQNEQRILITGASGQVGRKISKALSPHFDVVGLTRQSLDIGSRASLKKVFQTFGPNIVINAAAYTKVDEAERNKELAMAINYSAVKSLCELCSAHSSFLIHFSTDYVFDGLMASPYGENVTGNPLNVYGRSKLAGDIYITKKAQDYVIFRLAWVYDELGVNFPVKILNAAKVNDHLKVVDDQIGTPSSADFISKFVSQFVMKKYVDNCSDHQNIYNLVPNGSSSWFEFAKFLLDRAEQAGFKLKCKSKDVIPITSGQINQLAKRPRKVILANEKIQNFLGTDFAHWQVGADKFIRQIKRR